MARYVRPIPINIMLDSYMQVGRRASIKSDLIVSELPHPEHGVVPVNL